MPTSAQSYSLGRNERWVLVNLVTDLAAGEPLAYPLTEGRITLLSGGPWSDETGQIQYDELINLGAVTKSVTNPHCSILIEGETVMLTPCRDNSLTYVNGKLVTDGNFVIGHNDRLVLGTELALRLVKVAERRGRREASKILDWELCSKEFATEMRALRTEEEFLNLERQYEEALRVVNERDPGPCLVLLADVAVTQRVWPLPIVDGDAISFGHHGCDVTVAKVRGMFSLQRCSKHYLLQSAGATRKLYNGCRFSVNGTTFAVTAPELGVAPSSSTSPPVITPAPAPAYDNSEIRNAMFDLQFTVSQCFRVAVPPPLDDSVTDPHEARRQNLDNAGILSAERYPTEAMLTHLHYLRDSLQMSLTPELEEGLSDQAYLYEALRERNATIGELKAQMANLREELSRANDDERRRRQEQRQTVQPDEDGITSEGGTADDLTDDSRLLAADLSIIRLSHQESLIGQQAKRIVELELQLKGEHDALVSQNSPRTGAMGDAALLEEIRRYVITFSPAVASRIQNIATAAKERFSATWKRVIDQLQQAIDGVSNIHSIPEHDKPRLHLYLVDVVCCFEIGMRGHKFTAMDLRYVAKKRAPWAVIAHQCARYDANTPAAPSSRSSSRTASPAKRPTPVNTRGISPDVAARRAQLSSTSASRTSTLHRTASPLQRAPTPPGKRVVPGTASPSLQARPAGSRISPMTRNESNPRTASATRTTSATNPPASTGVRRSIITSEPSSRTGTPRNGVTPASRTQSPVVRKTLPQRPPTPTNGSRTTTPIGRNSSVARGPTAAAATNGVRGASPSRTASSTARPGATSTLAPLTGPRSVSPRTLRAQQLLGKSAAPTKGFR